MNEESERVLRELDAERNQLQQRYRDWLADHWHDIIEGIVYYDTHPVFVAFGVSQKTRDLTQDRFDDVELRLGTICVTFDRGEIEIRSTCEDEREGINDVAHFIARASMEALVLLRAAVSRDDEALWIEATEPLRIMAQLSAP